MNRLYCCETTAVENRAYADPTLLNDGRVLPNLLKTEEKYTLSFTSLNDGTEITPVMRKIVAEWMMEVCEDQKCQDEVFSLAINYMDRFLAVMRIRKNQLQLLGTACMLIASKLREPSPISAEILVSYTDYSITKDQLLSCELLVLSKLKWDMAAVAPQDFLSHILRRIPFDSKEIKYDLLYNHAKTLIALCAREYEFSTQPASIVASACAASALCGLGWPSKRELLNILHQITSIEQDYLLSWLEKVEKMVYANSGSAPLASDSMQRPEEFTPPPTSSEKFQEHVTAGTPTDVRDVHF